MVDYNTSENGSKKVQNKFQRNEPDFELNYLQSKDAVKILRLYTRENCQCRIAQQTEFKKTKVFYWTSKFLKHGLIDLRIEGKPRYYQLTAFGSKILTRSDNELAPVVLEDYAVKFRLVRDHGLIDWEKLGEPRNWVKLGVKVGGRVRVVKNGDSSIIIHPGQLQGFKSESLLVEAGEIIGIVFTWLQSHGVEVEPNGVPVHDPIFKFFTPEAEVLNRYGTVVTEDGSIDHSPPDAEPHVEFKGVQTARNYVDMPNRLLRVETKVDALRSDLSRVIESLDKFVEKVSDPLTRLANLAEAQQAESQQRKRPDFLYGS